VDGDRLRDRRGGLLPQPPHPDVPPAASQRRWMAYHVFYGGNPEVLLEECLLPLAAQLEEEGQTPLYDASNELYSNILDQQRLYLYHLNKEHANINEDIVNRFIRRIDLEQERLKYE